MHARNVFTRVCVCGVGVVLLWSCAPSIHVYNTCIIVAACAAYIKQPRWPLISWATLLWLDLSTRDTQTHARSSQHTHIYIPQILHIYVYIAEPPLACILCAPRPKTLAALFWSSRAPDTLWHVYVYTIIHTSIHKCAAYIHPYKIYIFMS